MTAPHSFATAAQSGAARLGRAWPIVLILFGANVCGALGLTRPAQLALSPLAERPGAWEADGSLPFVTLLESGLSRARAAEQGAQTDSLTPLFGIAFGLAVTGLIAAALTGGALLTYHEAPATFQPRRFVWGAWHWFITFMVLWLIEGVVATLAWLMAILLSVLLGGGAGMVFTALIALLVTALWGLVTDTARVAAVVARRRNPFIALGRGLNLLTQRPGAIVLLYLVSVVLAWGVTLGYLFAVGPWANGAPLGVMLVVQQVVIALRLVIRQWRLAGMVAAAG